MKKPTSKQVLNFFKEYFFVTLGAILNAISLFTFVNPATLVAGGFSGLSSALSYILVMFVDLDFDTLMSVIYFILNVPLLICALVLLRGDFTFKTIWATVVCTVMLKILPQQFKFENAIQARLIAIIFGGILIGLGMYISAEYNGSNGGTEVIAKIVAKYHPEMDLSKVILIFNFAITIVGSIIVIIVKGESFGVVMYSMMYVIVGCSVMGMLKRGFNHPQKFLIITTNGDAIGNAISENLQRGFSRLELGQGFDGLEHQMISVIVQARQTQMLKRLIAQNDPNAFTIVKEVYDVFSRPLFNRSYKTK